MELQSNKKALSLLLLIGLLGMGLSAATRHGAVEDGLTFKTTVTIENEMINMTPVTIHCKSKDDDLGTHVVAHGDSYAFSFHPNFLGGTLFFCGFTSSYGSVVVDIYKQARDISKRCDTLCTWQVHADGVIGFTQTLPSIGDLVFPWVK